VAAPFVLVVSAKSSARTVKDLLAFARANPGRLTYGSQGNGSVAHLSGVMLDLASGIRTTHVPYKGFAPAVTDLIAGRIDMFFADTINVLTRIRAGDVVPVAVASEQRLAALPEVPTFNESGLQAFVADAGFFMVAPARTPREIRERLTNEVRDALRLPEVADKFKALNATPLPSTAAELAEYLRVDSERWARVIRAAKITLD
jgi:tripartite-type tricarboxylate transporter receptor subunit TctC